jgi:hypothetical protein
MREACMGFGLSFLQGEPSGDRALQLSAFDFDLPYLGLRFAREKYWRLTD